MRGCSGAGTLRVMSSNIANTFDENAGAQHGNERAVAAPTLILLGGGNKTKLEGLATRLRSENAGRQIEIIRKEYSYADFMSRVRERLRSLPHPSEVVYACEDLGREPYFSITRLSLLRRCPCRCRLIDSRGGDMRLGWADFLLSDCPALAIELALSAISVVSVRLRARSLMKSAPTRRKLREFNRVAYLRTDLWFNVRAGGSVGHIAGVAAAMRRLGHQVFFISSSELATVDAKRAPIYVIEPNPAFRNLPELPAIAYNSRFNAAAAKILQKESPDLLYQRYGLSNLSGVHLSRKFGIPLVLEYSGSEVWASEHWGRPLKLGKLSLDVETANFRHADLIVVVSDPLREELVNRGVDPGKILVHPNGVDPGIYDPAATTARARELRARMGLHKKTVAGFIGTFGKWHGIDVLARVIAMVGKAGKLPDWHFLLIGDGPLMPDARRIIADAGAAERVTFTGLVPQLEGPAHLAACDVLLSPHVPNPDGSRFFGSPTKLFEYMATGKPIIASDLEQIGEVMRNSFSLDELATGAKNANGKIGVLVKPGDEDDLLKAMELLDGLRHLWPDLGRNARREALTKYTWDSNVKQVMAALKGRCSESGD